MASIIIGSAIAIGIYAKDRKEKKRAKAGLVEGQYSDLHGKPTVVAPRKQRKQEKEVVSDLPSYGSVVSGQQHSANGQFGDEKPPRYSAESTRRQ